MKNNRFILFKIISFNMQETLTDMMIREHGKMFGLLGKFRFQIDHLGNRQSAMKSYESFEKFHKEHIFVEEKIIIKYNNKIKNLEMAKVILKQHKELEKISQNIIKQTQKKGPILPDELFTQANKLQQMLIAHVKLEESQFYPFLDKDLPENEKKALIEQILKKLEV